VAQEKDTDMTQADASSLTIGFVGLGAMGLPMAENLLRAGYSVRGFDLNPAAVAAFAAAGGRPANGAAAAADGADILVLMVVNAEQADAVLFGADAASALKPGGTAIVMATCAPAAVEAMAARVTGLGRLFVDAPVSGGTVGAKAGSLTIMASADDATYRGAEPVLRAMGSRLYRVGDRPGQGAMVKTINQLFCGLHIAVAAEAFSLAEKAGLDTKVLLDIYGGSAASSFMLNNRGPRMLEDDGVVTSAVDIFVKDLGLVLDAGRQMKAPLPLAALAYQMFLATSGMGLGRKDDSQVIEAYRALARVTA
jgi:3-hydroxyisobutyrate dehydrogenase